MCVCVCVCVYRWGGGGGGVSSEIKTSSHKLVKPHGVSLSPFVFLSSINTLVICRSAAY